MPASHAPEITVLMSCYNASRWLSEAIESVLTQTFKDFEFIIIDDGSGDDTWSIIQDYRGKDDRIVAISKKNTGLADSLNVGIEAAKGKWIARIDADDICMPTRLEEQTKFVKNNPEVVLLGTGFIEIDEYGSIIKRHRYPSSHLKLVRHLERSKRFFPHSSAFYRVDVVKQVGAYNSRLRRAEDLRLWLELSLLGKIACLPKALVMVRKHSGQISRDNSGKQQFCDGTAVTVCHFLKKWGHRDPSKSVVDKEWELFFDWIEKRVDESGDFERHKVWASARARYFNTKNRMAGFFHFVSELLQTGQGKALTQEKIFGSQVPKRLAQDWIETTRQ
jgi:glycosyltransferase involved in cell wall biosynthesis